MAIASTNAVAVYLNPEATWAETPSSPAMQQLRYTGESLTFGKRTDVSATIRNDRMRDDIALLGWDTSGDLNFELEFFDLDDLLAGAAYGSWTGISTVSGTNISFATSTIADAGNRFATVPVGAYVWVSGAANASNNKRYRVTAVAAGALTVVPNPGATASAGPNVTVSIGGITATGGTTSGSTLTLTGLNPQTGTNLVVGQYVALSGFANAANNGIRRITAIGASTLGMTPAFVTEGVSPGVITIVGRTLRNGSTQRSFHLQKSFSDISQHISFRGMRVNTFSLNVTASEIVTGTVAFMGSQAVRSGSSAAGVILPTNNTRLMTASANVGAIMQGGSAMAVGVRSITFEINNNLRQSQQIGSMYPYAIGYGFSDITGTLEVYFEDATLYDQLINHTATEISFTLTDPYGHDYVVTFPSVILTEGYPSAGGGNDDVMLPLSFQAVRNATYGCQFQIDAIPDLTA